MIFVKMRLKVASKLLGGLQKFQAGVAKNSCAPPHTNTCARTRMHAQSYDALPENYMSKSLQEKRWVMGNTLGRCVCVKTILV